MLYTLYIHQFPNNKSYIGITKDMPVHRFGKDGCNYSKQNLMWKAINKYGWENIKHIIWATDLTKDEACKLEKLLIGIFNTNDYHYGYNNSSGGELTAEGSRRTEEQRKRYSEAFRSKPRTDAQLEVLHKIHENKKGKPAWNKGIKTGKRNLDEETKKRMYTKISKALTGRKVSDESKKKNSDAHKGKVPWNKGLKMTDELRTHYADYWKRKGN